MKKAVTSILFLFTISCLFAQLSPAVTSFLQNTTETGSYYQVGNSTAINNGILYNCQKVEYSNDFVYVHTKGIPAYPTSPFQDGNPSQASDQDLILKLPLNPQENTGTPIETNPGKIGVFINGVALYDWRDGVSWDPATQSICGGPGNPRCTGGMGASFDWNRDAIPAERAGFDCAKGHPARGDYHHHQNPSAFKLDLDIISDVCNLYDSDGLYAIDATQHSPLIGFANDGFPIYGAYGFKNTDGTGGITRIKSSYQLRNLTTRDNDGPDVDLELDLGNGNIEVLFLGYFREDYEYIANSEPDYLDEHNGRFCITPEYPNGTYAYFATVDESWNSAYPYVVGPTFYGQAANRVINGVNETTTVYDAISSTDDLRERLNVTVFPNPTADLIAIQINGLVKADIPVKLVSLAGQVIQATAVKKGQTIVYFDSQILYNGLYLVQLEIDNQLVTHKVVINR